jgi:hypothetical protein
MAAPTPPPLPARTGGYWTSTQWMVDDVSIGQYGDLTVVDLPEFQLDYESGTLTTRLRELPFFVLTPAVLSACKVTANTFCPITGKKGGPIFWCNASRKYPFSYSTQEVLTQPPACAMQQLVYA